MSTDHFIGMNRHYGITNDEGFLQLVGRGNCRRTVNVTHGRITSNTTIISIGVSSKLLSTGTRVIGFLGVVTTRPRVTGIPIVVSSSG